jgi:hypothetical protein
MDVNCSVLRFPTAEPMASKASLEGAKMVTSERELTVGTRLAAVKAPVREVRLAAAAVEESEVGMVRTVSIIWITPPVKLIFWPVSASRSQTVKA